MFKKTYLIIASMERTKKKKPNEFIEENVKVFYISLLAELYFYLSNLWVRTKKSLVGYLVSYSVCMCVDCN